MSRVQLRNQCVMVDGTPWFIFSGEISQYRLPSCQWRDRLEKVAAMGLNCIGVYAGWNFHSPEKDVYDFASPDRDFGKFLDEAKRVGLMVIARPGPYVCNEWDLGGYPGWLLREDPGDWRSGEPSHLRHCRQWYQQINRHLAPRQIDRNGSIILYQIENEHWFGDRKLLDGFSQMAREDGITVPLIGNGGGSAARSGVASFVDGCDIYTNVYEYWRWRGYFQMIRRLAGDAPTMVVEYAAGNFVQWGEQLGKSELPSAPAEWVNSLTRMFLGLGANVVNQFIVAAGITPLKYGSDHATTAYIEDAAVSHWGGIGQKFHATRLLAQAVESVNSLLAESRPLPDVWASDNANVEGLARVGQNGTFVVAVNYGTKPQKFRIVLPGRCAFPQTEPIAIAPRTSQFHMVDVDCGQGVILNYCTAQVMKFWRSRGALNLVVYAPAGTAGHIQLSVDGQPIREDFTCEDKVCPCRIGGNKPINLYAVSTARAERTWFVKAGTETVALFSTLDLVRPQTDGDVIRAEIACGAEVNLITAGVVPEIAGVPLRTVERPDGLNEYRAQLPDRGDVQIELSPPAYRAEDGSWTSSSPDASAGWKPVESCSPGREVITDTGSYQYIVEFECGQELPEYLEFLSISSGELVAYLNGQKLGVFPDRRPATYHALKSYALRLPVSGVVRRGKNVLAFTLTVIGRHNTGRPIFAGITHPIALYRSRREYPLSSWSFSGSSSRRYTHDELDQLSPALLAELEKRSWQDVELPAPLEPLSSDGNDWLNVQWYRAQVEIPPDMQNRPLFLECSQLDDAWCYVNQKCLGRTLRQMSTTFDLSAFSNEKSISVMIAARYYWHPTTTFSQAPRLVSAEAVVPSTLWRRPGPGDSADAASDDRYSQVPPQNAQALWVRQDVSVESPAGISAPLYVELDDRFRSHAVIFWNDQPIGHYADVGPDRRFYIPSGIVARTNRLSIFVDGHAHSAFPGGVKVGAYAQAVELSIRLHE